MPEKACTYNYPSPPAMGLLDGSCTMHIFTYHEWVPDRQELALQLPGGKLWLRKVRL